MRGRTYWHSEGVKCQHSAEGMMRKDTGQMPIWLFFYDNHCFEQFDSVLRYSMIQISVYVINNPLLCMKIRLWLYCPLGKHVFYFSKLQLFSHPCGPLASLL